MWASFSKTLNVLLSDFGIRRMIGRGVLSRRQYATLQKLEPEVTPQHACIVWIISRCLQGMKEQSIPDDLVLRDKIFERSLELQGYFAGVGGQLAGKIPLAYAHFVQILVDSFLLLAPFALYSELGIWSIPAVGILTLFYSGLLDLSKILLHPLGNDDDTYNESVNMDLAVIIRESNAGSTRWMSGGEALPFDTTIS
jgi:predicted membrane chloride channel (bestrophin family)